MDRWYAFKQFIKFNLIGILNTLIDAGISSLLLSVNPFQLDYSNFNAAYQWYYLGVRVLSYSCGMINSYLLNSKWTFKNENKKSRKQLILFILVNLVAFGVSQLVMRICVTMLQIPDLQIGSFVITNVIISNILSILVSVVVNFAGNKLFVFRSEKNRP